MAVVHLIVGRTGAGKTFVARRLEEDSRGVGFSIDAWMATLFIPDSEGPEFEWMMERIGRCESLIWKQAIRLLELNQNVVLDLGFSTREHRRSFFERAKQAGAECELHWVEAPLEVRRERVRSRNEGSSETYSFEVTDEIFNWMEDFFEDLDEQEKKLARIHENG